MYTFAVGHDASHSFGGYEGPGWDYITAPSADIAWLRSKRQWDMPFRLAEFRAAAHRADLIADRRYSEAQDPESRLCLFLEAKRV